MAMIHVIGAGLSGLACAVRLSLAGREVALYEAAAHAGGRCRSFKDEGLGCMLDNGSHMLMGSNRATRAYMADIGSADAVTTIRPAAFPFHDLASGESWCVRPTGGRIPYWLLSPGRRVAGSGAADYLAALRLAKAGPDDTVAECVGTDGVLYDRLWQPLSRAVLNTDASEGSARLLWKMIRETLVKGEAASRPMIFHAGLSAALIDPAIRVLSRKGAEIRMLARLRGLGWNDYRANALHFAEGVLRVAPGDAIVLAVPPDACADLWPDAKPPTESRAIVNAHFRLDGPVALPYGSRFLAVVNAESQWLFARDDILSVTVSAANRLVDKPGWEIANLLWNESARVLGRNVGRLPPWRVIKERRATIAQTPQAVAARPGPGTTLKNLFLAGDWTATGLPATIEGSIRSGFAAAQRALAYADTAARTQTVEAPRRNAATQYS